jgi:hypothetical protein
MYAGVPIAAPVIVRRIRIRWAQYRIAEQRAAGPVDEDVSGLTCDAPFACANASASATSRNALGTLGGNGPS